MVSRTIRYTGQDKSSEVRPPAPAGTLPKIWVTRPYAQAQIHAKTLSAAGFDPVICPVIKISPNSLPNRLPTEILNADGVIATSVNGIKHLPTGWLPDLMHRPIYVSGRATEELARQRGFTDVRLAVDAGSSGVVDCIEQDSVNQGSLAKMVYFAGATRTPYLEQVLGPKMHLITIETYAAQPAATIAAELKSSLSRDQIAATTLFSSRSAEYAAELLRDNVGVAFQRIVGEMLAVCISDRVCRMALACGFKKVVVSKHETDDSIVNKLVEQLKSD